MDHVELVEIKVGGRRPVSWISCEWFQCGLTFQVVGKNDQIARRNVLAQNHNELFALSANGLYDGVVKQQFLNFANVRGRFAPMA